MTSSSPQRHPNRVSLDAVVIRFAGDSSDGMQLIGGQFSQASARMGNDLATFPDFPAEISAPAGTIYGVSGFQLQFSSHEIHTPGDAPGVLVIMNPAALAKNLPDLPRGGLLVINEDAFTPANLKKAGFTQNPLEDGSLESYRCLPLPISKMTLAAVEPVGLSTKPALRCKNLWTLGLMMWIYDRAPEGTIEWLKTKFAHKPQIAQANIAALKAGHAYAETAELPSGIDAYRVPKAVQRPGLYRNITGAESLSLGLAAVASLSGMRLVLGSYPITPASSLLHALAKLKGFNIVTFQAEDEIAAICGAIGASYAGALGITSTSGPGLALKTEALGLAVMTELPLVVINVQRGGPSTGLPTKTEQSDLLQCLYGRNGDCPLIVLAASGPGDCFHRAIEASRLALRYMTPVILLSDGYIANGAEPWAIPQVSSLEAIECPPAPKAGPDFHPYLRDPNTLARVWARPGMEGLAHRIGGLEKDYNSGNISYVPENHQKMTDTRAAKIAGAVADIPDQTLDLGVPSKDTLLVVGWGSTRGVIRSAVQRLLDQGQRIASTHLHHMHPLPANMGELLAQFDRVVVAEMNNGMLVKVLRSEYLIDVQSICKVTGQPFKIDELCQRLLPHLSSLSPSQSA